MGMAPQYSYLHLVPPCQLRTLQNFLHAHQPNHTHCIIHFSHAWTWHYKTTHMCHAQLQFIKFYNITHTLTCQQTQLWSCGQWVSFPLMWLVFEGSILVFIQGFLWLVVTCYRILLIEHRESHRAKEVVKPRRSCVGSPIGHKLIVNTGISIS